ncbi:MAG: 16S rRNA (guanine(527)-N(7))-methyltransferase RsmG [Ignavibacteriales bacterium]|nr:16S rRNA (guanine(527)-N(7))-methyltransferase RsmG [Ignavibacteriales bacterium]
MTFQQIKNIFESNNRSIDEIKFSHLEKYVALLLEENQKVNLISRKDAKNVWEQHILHSLALVLDSSPARSESGEFRGNDKWNGKRIIDIGTGGGLPGIPIKILLPDISLTLLDSIQKKIHCVQRIVNDLKLNNVNVICGRAEEIGKQKEFSRQYDIVVSRAVAPLVDLVNWSKLFLKKGGKIIALKGGNLDEEVNECRTRFNLVPQVFDIDLKGMEYLKEAEKKIVVVKM